MMSAIRPTENEYEDCEHANAGGSIDVHIANGVNPSALVPLECGKAADASVKRVVDLSEPIGDDFRACIEEALAVQPGARVIKRRGHLFIKTRRGAEILCQHLYEAKQRWIEAGVEHADIPEGDKWKIFCLLVGGDARLERVPGVGLNYPVRYG
jgi:hypothetical protein